MFLSPSTPFSSCCVSHSLSEDARSRSLPLTGHQVAGYCLGYLWSVLVDEIEHRVKDCLSVTFSPLAVASLLCLLKEDGGKKDQRQRIVCNTNNKSIYEHPWDKLGAFSGKNKMNGKWNRKAQKKKKNIPGSKQRSMKFFQYATRHRRTAEQNLY